MPRKTTSLCWFIEPTTLNVFRDASFAQGETKTFVPSLELLEGATYFLVGVEYIPIDTDGPESSVLLEIVDCYDEFDKAMAVGMKIKEHNAAERFASNHHDVELVLGTGEHKIRKYMSLPWCGSYVDIHRIFIKKFVVSSIPDFVIIEPF